MERFSYKGGYGIHGLARIEAFKRRAGLHGMLVYTAPGSQILEYQLVMLATH